jgi:hypothetical protein
MAKAQIAITTILPQGGNAIQNGETTKFGIKFTKYWRNHAVLRKSFGRESAMLGQVGRLWEKRYAFFI